VTTTLTNTTFLFLCVILIACLVRYARRGDNEAGAWMRDGIRRLSGSKLLIGVLVIGGAVGMGSHLLVGYLGPGDFFQDFVGVKELAAGRSLNPTTNMRERVEYWLSQGHLESTVLSRWGPLRRLEASSIDSGARQLVVQAHPPFHILLIAPIVELCGSIRRTFVALTAVNLAGYILLLYLLWRSTNLPALVPAGAAALLFLLALDWQPLLANLRQAQIGVVVALLVIAAWYCLTRDRPWLAGVLIGLAALIKMFPALLFFWLLLRRRRAFVAGLATVFIAALFLYSIRGPAAFVDYYHAARAVEEEFGRSRINYSPSAVISYVIAGPTAKSIWASAAVAFADVMLFGYSAFLTLRKRTPTQFDEALEFSGYIALACLLSPTVEAFYYPILLLPIATVASMIRPAALVSSSIALLAILWCFSFPDQLVWRPTQLLAPLIGDRLSFLICSFPTFGLLGLWYWIERRQQAETGLSQAFRQSRPDTRPTR
jgi:hypothetical protein